jgi:hypothetical protein
LDSEATDLGRLPANNRAENLYGAAGVKRGELICKPLLGDLSAGSRLAPIDRLSRAATVCGQAEV